MLIAIKNLKMAKKSYIFVGRPKPRKLTPEEKWEAAGMKHYEHCLAWLLKNCNQGGRQEFSLQTRAAPKPYPRFPSWPCARFCGRRPIRCWPADSG